MQTRIAIIMGSDSDLAVMQEAARVLDEFDVPYYISVVSAHRTPERLFEFAKTAADKGFSVIIAGAGGAAHLPGMVASLTHLPVIGVPVQSKMMKGVDSLYSIVQMPPGVPVATVAINGAGNAALLALQILGVSDEAISEQLKTHKQKLKTSVEKKAGKLEKDGWKKYSGEA